MLQPSLKLQSYASLDEAIQAFNSITVTLNSASKDPVNGLPKLLLVAALIDPSSKTRTDDGHDLVSALTAELTTVVGTLGFGTFGRWELEQRAGGPISSNVGVDYAKRVNSVERAQIERLAPGKLAGWLRQLATAPRMSANQAARAKADSFGDPTGQLGVPTVTMHTAYDDVVPVQEETVFAERVQKEGRTDLLE